MQLVFYKTKEKSYYQQIKVKVLIIYPYAAFLSSFLCFCCKKEIATLICNTKNTGKVVHWMTFSLSLLL